MKNEYVTINGKRQYVNASHHARFTKQPVNTFHTQITPEELGNIRQTAGVSGTGPLPEHFQTIIDDQTTKQAIGKGVVSDIAETAARRGILTDDDFTNLQHARETYHVDANLNELKHVSPAVKIALENRGSYDTLVKEAMNDGLIDRVDANQIETAMMNKGLTKDAMNHVVASDSTWQKGARNMEQVRSHVKNASQDMYLTQQELAGLSPEAQQALVREGNQPYLDATKNTEFMKERMKYVQKDNAYQASKELFSTDMAAERKRYLNEQQDILESTRSNPGFAAAADEHGVDQQELLNRSQAMRKEAHALKREMVDAGRTRKQQQLYRETGLVGSAEGSKYAPNTYENRAKFGSREDLRVDRVLTLQNEATALQKCVENNDCSNLGLDLGEAKESLSRVTKATDTLREKQINTWFSNYKHAQGKRTTQEVLDETFRHGGQQPSRWERTKETIQNAPGAVANTIVDSGKAAVVYGKKTVTETGKRLKQTARVLDKAVGSPIGVSRATVTPQVLPKHNGKVIVAQPKIKPSSIPTTRALPVDTPPSMPKPAIQLKNRNVRLQERGQSKGGFVDLNPPTAALPKTATRPAVGTIQLKNRNVRLQERGQSKGGFVDLNPPTAALPKTATRPAVGTIQLKNRNRPPLQEHGNKGFVKPKITMHRKVPKPATVKPPQTPLKAAFERDMEQRDKNWDEKMDEINKLAAENKKVAEQNAQKQREHDEWLKQMEHDKWLKQSKRETNQYINKSKEVTDLNNEYRTIKEQMRKDQIARKKYIEELDRKYIDNSNLGPQR